MITCEGMGYFFFLKAEDGMRDLAVTGVQTCALPIYRPYEVVANDADARFHSLRVYQTKEIEPTVAKPHSPDNRDTAFRCRDVVVDRAYIGSCTGGDRESPRLDSNHSPNSYAALCFEK